jgi:hypothetical protein
MQVKVDVRNQLGIVTSRASDLLKAIRELPETEEDMVAALQAMGREERTMAQDYLLRLSQQFYELRQRTQWLRYRVQESLDEPARSPEA